MDVKKRRGVREEKKNVLASSKASSIELVAQWFDQEWKILLKLI